MRELPLRCICGYQPRIERLEKALAEVTAERDELRLTVNDMVNDLKAFFNETDDREQHQREMENNP